MPTSSSLLLRCAFAVRSLGKLMRGLGVLMSLRGALVAPHMVVLAVMLGGSLVGFRRVLVVLGRLEVRLLHHFIFLLAGKCRPMERWRQ